MYKIDSQRKDTQGIPHLKKKNGSGIAQSDFEKKKAEEFNSQLTVVVTDKFHFWICRGSIHERNE